MHELREAFAQRQNIMRLFRERTGASENTTEAVLAAYDLQAGNYRAQLRDPVHHARKEHNTAVLARVLDELDGERILDAGTGEATTLCTMAAKLKRPPRLLAGFDLSWSRIAHARVHARGFPGVDPHFFTGDLFHIPVADDSFDIVFTSHALEPNHGREQEALAGLARVSRRWIALFEPCYEFGGEGTRRAIEEKGYVRGLADAARTLGLEVVRHQIAGFQSVPNNETGLLLLRKPVAPTPPPEPWLACPRCQHPLQPIKGQLYCPDDCLVFPVLDGIPCLLPGNGILASQFASEF